MESTDIDRRQAFYKENADQSWLQKFVRACFLPLGNAASYRWFDKIAVAKTLGVAETTRSILVKQFLN